MTICRRIQATLICAAISSVFILAAVGNIKAKALPTISNHHGKFAATKRAAAFSENMIKLGMHLFNSPLLSRDNTLSCATCHVPDLGLSGPFPTGIGVDGQVGRRHPPTLINVFANKSFMWDGRFSSLEAQIHSPLESKDEMAIDWSRSLARLRADIVTRKLAASSGLPLDEKLAIKALVSYLSSVRSDDSPFDRYFFGSQEDAISPEAKAGFQIFQKKAGCVTCHLVTGLSAPFTDESFHSVGVGYEGQVYKDDGRFLITHVPSDKGLFKTPTLRNVAQRQYFMHDGSFSSLRSVVEYYNSGANPGAPNRDARLRPLGLSDREIDQLVAFLETLTGSIRTGQ